MLWEFGLLLLFVLAPQAAETKESSVGLDSGVKTEAVGSGRLMELLKASAQTEGSGFEVDNRRSKRSVFLHSGVRICPQETINEVLASHQAYYQLRVCQEAVWEAFRIFFDRIPGTAEYQRWVHTCQHESLCISDLAKNFSSSEEHMSMIHRRMNRRRDRPRKVVTPAATQKIPEIAGAEVQTVGLPVAPPTVGLPVAPLSVTSSTTVLLSPVSASPSPGLEQIQPAEEVEEDSELPNVVPESPLEQIVEFSIDLVDPGYRELLDDPDSPQYVDLAHHLQDQMQHVFDKLPGFKSIYVLGIRPGGISVHYSLVFEINSPKINSENSETATGRPESSANSGLREMVTKALRDEASLPIDLDSLNFEPEAILLPALTSTSSVEVVNEPNEPDSHNEFEVFTDEPEVDKPRLVVPLTPLEKENALVTLLDPTAVPDDETMVVTGGTEENSDHSPVSEDIIDESEAVYVSESEPSNEKGEEEELLIITHEIETIHHDETGELVRDYIPTPPVIPELVTDAPYISLSPNLILEEDEDNVNLSLDVVTPTAQNLLTTAFVGEELSDLGLSITTLSDVTDQPPTESIVNLQEDEEVNALPDEEEAELGLPEPYEPGEVSETEAHNVSELEPEVEFLEPEGEFEVGPDELLEVLQPTPEQMEISVPEEGNLEVSEPELGTTHISKPEEGEAEEGEVVELSEPEEEITEKEEEVVSIPKKEVTEEEDVAEVSEPEEKVTEKEEEAEVSIPKEEVTKEEDVAEVSEPEEKVTEEEEVVNVSEPEGKVTEEEKVTEVSELEEKVTEKEEEAEVSIPKEEITEEEDVAEVSELEEKVTEDEKVTEVSELEEKVTEKEEEAEFSIPKEEITEEEDVAEVLEPEERVTEKEVVVEVLDSEEEVTDEEEVAKVSEPEEEVAEEEEVATVSEPEEEMAKVPEPEEELVVEYEEEVAASKPEEKENELEISEPVEVSEPKESNPETEPDDGTVEILKEEGVEGIEVLQPEKEIVEVVEKEDEEDIFEVSHPSLAPEKDEEIIDQAPETEKGSEFGEDEVLELLEASEETIHEVSEQEAEVFKEEAVDVVEPVEKVTEVSEPDDETEESKEEVIEISKVDEKVLEAPTPDEGVVNVLEPAFEPEPVPEQEGHVTEIIETGYEVDEAAGSEERLEKVSESSVEVVEVAEMAPDPEKEPEVPDVPQPKEDTVEDVKPEQKVIAVSVSVQEKDPVDISEPYYPLETEKEAADVLEEKQKEVFETPEKASEPGQDVDHVIPPAEELPGVSDLESEEEVVVDAPEPSPEDGLFEIIKPEPEENVTDPPAESIKILHPLDGRGRHQFVEDTVQAFEDNEFHQPVRPDFHWPNEKDDLPIIPINIQPSEDDVSEPDHEYPIIDDFNIEEDVDSIDTKLEGETGAFPTTETSNDELQFETTSDIAEETAQDNQDTSRGTEVTEDLPEDTQESDSSPERDISITVAPVSDSFPTPPATSVDVSEVSAPSPTIDSGLFEVSESEIPSAPESSEDDNMEAETEQSEPAVVIIDEDLEETMQKGGENPPAATEDVIDVAVKDLAVELDQTDVAATEPNELPDEGSGFPSVGEERTTVSVTAPPPVRYLTTPFMTTANQGRELVVFFSLRVTNLNFSEDLFNKTSPEYRSLENTFLDVLLPFLQANLTGFKKLEILNFRKGSVVINSKMKFAKSVPYNITEAVHCVLEEFCSAASKNLRIQIDTHSLDVEPADQADACKFLACDEFSRCVVNGRTKEGQCLCEPGFLSVNGLPCQSLCVLQPDYCQGGDCHIVPGHGAVCRYKDSFSLPGLAS